VLQLLKASALFNVEKGFHSIVHFEGYVPLVVMVCSF
jgi:hypothetical protein